MNNSSNSAVLLRVQANAARVGIKDSTTLSQKSNGRIAIATAFKLWRESQTRIDLETLAALCDVFRCGVNKILVLSKSEEKV